METKYTMSKILMDNELEKYISEYNLVEFADPMDLGEKQVGSSGISGVSVNLTLGNKFDLLVVGNKTEPIVVSDVVRDLDLLKSMYTNLPTRVDAEGFEYVDIPANGKVLGVSREKLNLPDDIYGEYINKSTWARFFVTQPTTLLDPGWSGFLTLELINHMDAPIRIYVGDGIGQVVFSKLNKPVNRSYRVSGKYNDQPNSPVLPKPIRVNK